MSEADRPSDLLRVARVDLDALRGMERAADADRALFGDAIFGFHAQQAIEKSLKARLAFLGADYPFTRDIKRLVELLVAAGQTVEIAAGTTRFNSFAVTMRYEASGGDPPLDRRAVLAQVEAVVAHVGAILANGS